MMRREAAMPDRNSIPLDNQLCFALYSTEIAVHRLFKPLLDARGITYPQYLVLCVLWERDGRTISAISDRLFLEASTITPLVQRLERAGLVARDRSPEDERQVFVRVTKKGLALASEMNCLAGALQARSGMSAAQILSLNEKLKSFRDTLADGVDNRKTG
jgi:MarR family transcriptional regulator, organic hydroperoxide resistance regulator